MIRIERNKHVYAAFLNMAQQNFFSVMSYVAQCMGLKPTDNIPDKLSSKKFSHDKKVRMCELLKRHFPFLHPMAEVYVSGKKASDEIDAIRLLLTKISKVLYFYRNYTTHFDPDEDDEIEDVNLSENSMIKALKALNQASIRTVQQRFGYTEYEIGFIKNMNWGKEGFSYSLYKKELISNRDSKPKDVFSIKGLICFTALFLEKKYISELLSKTKAFYTSDDLNNAKRKKIILESLSVFRTILPKKRYVSQEDKMALALDMVNELQRCPMELFDLLSTDDKNLFRSEEKDDADPNTMLMIRHRDRFPEFVLKFIDQKELFKELRFQVRLGKYRFAFYDKKCIDADLGADLQVRTLQKDLHGFGRLQEIERERQEKWGGLIRQFEDVKEDTVDSVPYITDQRASYLIDCNKVGIYWKMGKDDPKPGLPTLPDDPQAKNMRERRKAGEELVKLQAPKCFISTHELQSLMFYLLICDGIDKKTLDDNNIVSTERIIEDWVKGFRTIVEGVLDKTVTAANVREEAAKFGINYDKDLPVKLKDFINNNLADTKADKQKLQKRLEQHLLETKTRLERFKENAKAEASKLNKRGKKRFVEIKSGNLGKWLAHDIVAIQPVPKSGNGKLTGLNFNILQSALSVYRGLDDIKRILVSSRLVMHEDEHPFLMRVLREEPQNTKDFYRKYLEWKIRWLKEIKNRDLKEYDFLKRGENKWREHNEQYYRNVLQQYLSLPVELPRSLFAESIKNVLTLKFGKDFVKGTTRDDANVSLLIGKYLKRQQDDSQEFYTQPQGMYKRHYGFFKLLSENNDYGKTIVEVDNLMRNDVSIGELNGARPEKLLGEKIEKGLEEIKLKLAKARARNAMLDEGQKIREIIKMSVNLNRLSAREQNSLLQLALRDRPKAKETGIVPRYLSKFMSEAERTTEKEKLKNGLRKMKATEQRIRQIKVQDIVLFMMAKNLLFEGDKDLFGNKFDQFKLKEIRPIRRQGDASPLEIKIPFSITIMIKGSNVPVRIYQDSIKLKNYGDFHRFLHDSRLETLIPYLQDDTNAVRVEINREDLEREFANYDSERFEVFANVHKIERMILERHRELKEKSSSSYYYEDKGKAKPRRSNFSKLLEYSNILTDKDESEAVNIRNSFAHNVYIGEGFDKVSLSTSSVGEIAPAIGEKMEEKTENIKAKNNR